MKRAHSLDFIVIDDDSINNMISTEFIKLTVPDAKINTFTNPEKGLAHLLEYYSDENTNQVILFLDINMPVMSGWEALEEFQKFPATIKEKTTIYMLSSSVDANDKELVAEHPLVSGYITKFLSAEKLKSILQ